MKKYCVLCLAIFLVCTTNYAQDGYYVDALRYSFTQFGGSARMIGLAGAGASLGADLGTVYYNPAGLGFYRKSDISISPNVGSSSTNSNYLGNNATDSKVFFSINNVGVAFCFKRDPNSQSDWRGGTLSITQNRIANFQNTINFNGNNSQNSIADALVQQSNGINSNDLSSTGKYANTLQGLAYQSYITNPDNTGSNYYNWLPQSALINQQGNLNTTGSISQWDLSYGNNYKDKVYVGGSLGLYGLVYNQNRTYNETLLTNSTDVMTNLSLSDQLRVTGNGLNANIGVIVRPVDFIRIGLGFRTPTILWLTENYSATLSANYQFSSYSGSNPPSSYVSTSNTPQSYNYSMIVPYRANGGVSIFFNKYGFVSLDAEYVDYTSATLMQNDNYPTNFSKANNNIHTAGNSSALNLRGGLEARIDIFRLRGGFAYYSSPYANNLDNVDRSMKVLTFGAGVKFDNHYYDIAFMQPVFNTGYQPYSVNNMGSNPFATTKSTTTNITLTMGFNF